MLLPTVMASTLTTMAHCDAVGRGIHAINRAGQRLKLSTVGGAKVKADVGTSHAKNVAHQAADGNLVSGGEH